MGNSIKKNNNLPQYNSDVLAHVPSRTIPNIHMFYFKDKDCGKMQLKIAIDAAMIVEENYFSYDNVMLRKGEISKPILILRPDENMPTSLRRKIIFSDGKIEYDKYYAGYDYYLKDKRLYKKNTTTFLIVTLKKPNLIDQTLEGIIKTFSNNYHRNFKLAEKNSIQLKIHNIKQQHDLLQLLKENQLANITLLPKITIINEECHIKFYVSTIDDVVYSLPVAEQVIIIDNAVVI